MADQRAGQGPEPGPQGYHAGHAARAFDILRALSAAGMKLRKADARRCKDYAVDVFGHAQYAPWLLVYASLSGGFKEGWIPDNFYGAKVVPAIQGTWGHLSFQKSLSGKLFGSPAFPDVGARINGALLDRDYRALSFDEASARFFEAGERIVFKPDHSGRGKNIRFFDRTSFDRSALEGLGNGVFQQAITHHPLFDIFSTAAVAAVRITTVVEPDGAISLRAAYLCFASGSETHVQSQTRTRVPVDVASGKLRDTGLLASWVPCNAHPTSGEPFAGKVIPAFDQCRATVIAHHRRIPFVGAVGWDVTVDSDNAVRILEWNAFHNGITFSEGTVGPCFTGLGWERFA